MVPGGTAEETSHGMNDAPRKWWNRLDAAVKTMGLLPARADRCTYISYADVKKKTKQVAHASGDNEATQSFEQTGHPLDEENYTMRSMRTSCSSSWRRMSMTSSGCGLLM